MHATRSPPVADASAFSPHAVLSEPVRSAAFCDPRPSWYPLLRTPSARAQNRRSGRFDSVSAMMAA